MDVTLAGAHNFRGLAGLRAEDGRAIIAGRLFRSAALNKLSPDDLAQVQSLGIGLVCDLRSPIERKLAPHCWLTDASPAWIFPPYSETLRAVQKSEWLRLLMDPGFDEQKAKQVLARAYCSMPRVLTDVLVALFRYCETEGRSAVLVNCAAGKDRTGFVIALLMWAIGIPYDIIMEDYLRSREGGLVERHAHDVISSLYPATAPPRAIKAAKIIFSVNPDTLDAVIKKLAMNYGSVDNYLRQAAGLTSARKALLQDFFLE